MRSWKKFLATDCRASSDHSENQSIVQQVMRLGNCCSQERNTSPIGLEVRGGEGEGGEGEGGEGEGGEGEGGEGEGRSVREWEGESEGEIKSGWEIWEMEEEERKGGERKGRRKE